MAETAQVTDASAFEKRSLGKQAVFAIVTVGLYSLYWFYTTAKQLDEGTDRSLSPRPGVHPVRKHRLCLADIRCG
ncbi:MAG: DUF4234 domain-containing protein [Haloplanus sp.]